MRTTKQGDVIFTSTDRVILMLSQADKEEHNYSIM